MILNIINNNFKANNNAKIKIDKIIKIVIIINIIIEIIRREGKNNNYKFLIK